MGMGGIGASANGGAAGVGGGGAVDSVTGDSMVAASPTTGAVQLSLVDDSITPEKLSPTGGAADYVLGFDNEGNGPQYRSAPPSTPADDSITNIQINSAAGIDGTKISPDFGSQTIQTLGGLQAASASIAGNTEVTSGGALSVAGDFAVNTNKFTVEADNGNTLAAGTLDVTGAIAGASLNIGGGDCTVDADGIGYFNGSLTVGATPVVIDAGSVSAEYDVTAGGVLRAYSGLLDGATGDCTLTAGAALGAAGTVTNGTTYAGQLGGTLILTTDGTPGAAGTCATIALGSTTGLECVAVVCAADDISTAKGFYVEPGTDQWVLKCTTALAASTAYKLNYIVIQVTAA